MNDKEFAREIAAGVRDVQRAMDNSKDTEGAIRELIRAFVKRGAEAGYMRGYDDALQDVANGMVRVEVGRMEAAE